MKRKESALRYSIVLMVVVFSFCAARADVTGAISGTVHDPGQAVVAGARVRIVNVQTNVSQESTTAADGSFHFLALQPGAYKITVTAAGFQTYTDSGITLQVNDQLRVGVTLQVGTVAEHVDVSASAVHVETENTQMGDVIDSKKMLALPLNGRSYLDLLGLQAGVAPTTAGTLLGNTASNRPVSGYITNAGNVSVNGQRETANAFLVNGGDVSEGRNLGAGLVPNLDSVEEFRLITNSFDAEYGKFSGAVMNAITKSGTNGFHGDVFEFLRNDMMDARNYFTLPGQAKSELHRNQFGFTAGGPFWKNKVFWFTDYQGTRQVQGAETGGYSYRPPPNVRVFSAPPLTGSVDGTQPAGTCPACGWPTELSTRLGYPVHAGEPIGLPAAILWPMVRQGRVCFRVESFHRLRSPRRPSELSLPSPPLTTNRRWHYSDNSGRNTIKDDKIGERVDFNSQKTGNWSFYYHFDDSTVSNALPSGVSSAPGFPTITPTRAQEFVMSNTKTIGPPQLTRHRLTFFRTSTHSDTPTAASHRFRLWVR